MNIKNWKFWTMIILGSIPVSIFLIGIMFSMQEQSQKEQELMELQKKNLELQIEKLESE